MNNSRERDTRIAYSNPVGLLLNVGRPGSYDPAEWPDYAVKFGLGREDIPELIRLACDAALSRGLGGQRRLGTPACLAGVGSDAG